MKVEQRKPQYDLEATPDDPLLGVHVLSQFVFCPRAGVCSYEARQEVADDEPSPAQLDLLPRYDIHDIENAFSEGVTRLTLIVSAMLFFLAAGYYMAMNCAPWLSWMLPVIALPFGVSAVPVVEHLFDLSGRHRAFTMAKASEPDPDCEENQPVHWFAMLKAGFMSVSYHRLTHERWKLEGRPWRVLRRGNLRIPVFFQPETDERLHPKHLAKVAAYCHLLQAVENYESPYALVLKENSLEGLAVPYNARSRKVFHEVLRLARRTLRDQNESRKPPAPEQISLCSGCPYGKPRRYRPGETDEVQTRLSLPVFVLADQTETIHHSLCGDRFRWMPPHKDALAKTLQPIS